MSHIPRRASSALWHSRFCSSTGGRSAKPTAYFLSCIDPEKFIGHVLAGSYDSIMNYKISFQEEARLAMEQSSKQSPVTLTLARKQV